MVGPISKPAVNDRITVALLPSGDLRNVHRKSDLQEIWRHTPASIEAEFRLFLSKNLVRLYWSELGGPQTYVVSLYRRVMPLLVPFGRLVGLSVPFLTRLVFVHDKTNEVYQVDTARAVHFAKSFSRSPAALMAKPLEMAPRASLPFLKLFARFFLLNPRDKKRISEDFCFLVSPTRNGFILPSKSGGLCFLPLEPIVEVLKSVQVAMPIRLDDVGGLLAPGTTVTIS